MKFFFLILSFFFVFHFASFSQKTNKKQPNLTTKIATTQKLPLVETSKNKIQFATSLSNFKTAIKALQKKKRNLVTIIHIGDSHIQSDFFSGKLRAELQHKYGNAGRGLIFPYKEAGSSQPENYIFDTTGKWEGKSSMKKYLFSQWGLSGYTLQTSEEKATLTFKTTFRHPEKITSIKVLHPKKSEKDFDLLVKVGNKIVKASKKTEKNYTAYKFKKSANEILFTLQKTTEKQSQFLLQGLLLESNERGIMYHSAGVNGANIETFLRCADFQDQIAALKPDLLIISLGTNDALVPNFDTELFKVNCKLLIQQIKTAAPNASLLFTSPNVSYNFDKKMNKNLDILSETLQAIAANKNAAFWDFYTIAGKKENTEQWHAEGLLKNDYIHLTSKGYKLQADLLLRALNRVMKSKIY